MKEKDREKKTKDEPKEEDEKVTPLEIALFIGCTVLLVVIVVLFMKLRG